MSTSASRQAVMVYSWKDEDLANIKLLQTNTTAIDTANPKNLRIILKHLNKVTPKRFKCFYYVMKDIRDKISPAQIEIYGRKEMPRHALSMADRNSIATTLGITTKELDSGFHDTLAMLKSYLGNCPELIHTLAD